ncbi:unnamed protein product [Nippostrongylus brasiliensis]|uniref:SAP30_Sin3_bdg domain-containing protein n=1 Tax=Nippostrongylus brasiliensis TaxID=27835 RepID=A0A0N4Y0P6_NIPBR|nr:unnamed protein product [Nippostrongylus brasiliensis]
MVMLGFVNYCNARISFYSYLYLQSSATTADVKFRFLLTVPSQSNLRADLDEHGYETATTAGMMKRYQDAHEKRHLLHQDDEVFEECLMLKPLPESSNERKPRNREDEEEEDAFVDEKPKKRRRRGRRRSGSFTGGVWPRKRGRLLLGYAIPPPNVHSTDWRDMLAITESRDSHRDDGSSVRQILVEAL